MGTGIGRHSIGRAAAIAAATALAACQPATGRIPAATGIVAASSATAEQLGAPRVTIQTEYEGFGIRRVRTRLRLEEDAYVLVVNVAPDGLAQVVFPESPKDNGLLRGDRSYVLPGFFSGYPSVALETQSTATRFVQISRSIYASPMIRGPGYIFALASRTPFDMQRLEDEGFFDWVDFGNQLYELDPEHIIGAVAEVALWDVPNFIATTDVARYAGYDPTAGERMALAYASGRQSAYCPSYTMTASLMSQVFYSEYGHYYPQTCLSGNPYLRYTGRVVQPPRDSTKRPPFPLDTSGTKGPIWRRQGADTSGGGAPIWRRRSDEVAPRAIDPVIVSESEAGRVRPFAPGRLQEDEIELTTETRNQMLRRHRFTAGTRRGAEGEHLAPPRAGTLPRPTNGSTYESSRAARRSSVSPRDSRTTRARPTRSEAHPTRSEPSASPRPSGSSAGGSSATARASTSSGSSSSSGSASSGKRQVTPR